MTQKQYPIPVVACGIIDEEDNILLMKRSKEPYKDYWCLPGGKIEFGETIQQACIREIHEEAGIVIEFRALKGILSEVVVDERGQMHVILFACEAHPLDKILTASDEGEVEWFSLHVLESMKDVIIPSDYYMIKEFILKDNPIQVTNVTMVKKGNKYNIESLKQLHA